MRRPVPDLVGPTNTAQGGLGSPPLVFSGARRVQQVSVQALSRGRKKEPYAVVQFQDPKALEELVAELGTHPRSPPGESFQHKWVEGV